MNEFKATVSPSWTFKQQDVQRVVLALPQLCSALCWRRPASVCCRSSLPCWPASAWGTTPRPSDPASESPGMSGSSAPGSRHTHTHTDHRLDELKWPDWAVWENKNKYAKQTHVYHGSRQRVVGMLLHFTNVLPTLTEQTGPGSQTPRR